MKSLYDKNQRYTQDAINLDWEASQALHQLMNKYKDSGFSVREITHIVQSAASMLECEMIMDLTAPSKETKDQDLTNLYPKWHCPLCKDWFHMPYKYCKCPKKEGE